MSIIHALQNGSKNFKASNANVSINVGNGNSNIAVTAGNAAINTGCGNQNIVANIANNLSIDTGCCGTDIIQANVGGNAQIVTRDGDDFIDLTVGGNFYVDAGMDKPNCVKTPDDDVVLIHADLDNFSGQNYVGLGDGNDIARIIGNNVAIQKNEGNNLNLGFYGDNYNILSEANNNKIGFWGDNVAMTITGAGVQDIKTLDYSFEKGEFMDFGFEDLFEQDRILNRTINDTST